MVVAVTIAAGQSLPFDRRPVIAERVTKLTRDSSWKSVTSVPLAFTTYHPQGMVKIGDTLFVSSVEVRVPTRRLPQPADGYDRDAGEGAGHLFKFDMAATSWPISSWAKEPSTTLAGSTMTESTSGCRWPSIARTADRSFTASIPRP